MTAEPTRWQKFKKEGDARLATVDREYNRVMSAFRLWMFGDVTFAVLPIMIMAVVMGIVQQDFHEFLLMKEWSFASIVLYGVAIRKLIKLKIEVQLAPRSPKLDAGVQFYVLLVILAAVVLAFVILAEFKRVSPVNTHGLEFAQMGLFGLSLLSVWQAVWYEENWTQMMRSRTGSSQRLWFYRYAKIQVDEAVLRLYRLNDTLDHLASATPDVAPQDFTVGRRREKLIAETLTAIECLKVSLSDAEKRLRVQRPESAA